LRIVMFVLVPTSQIGRSPAQTADPRVTNHMTAPLLC
jgi:hypothetical protein